MSTTQSFPDVHFGWLLSDGTEVQMDAVTLSANTLIGELLSTSPIDEVSSKGTPPPALTGVVLVNSTSTVGPSTFATQATPSPSANATTDSASSGSASLPSTERSSSPLARKLAVGLAVPAATLLIGACILFGMYLRRRRHRHWNVGPSSSPRSSKSHKQDYNAKPLYPHKPLTSRSDSTFTVDAGPSYGSIPQAGDADIPQLPELEGLTAAYSPTRDSEYSSDDFGPYFSGIDDPFTDAAASTVKMTPGVSPSSYPLRDRLSHENERRRKAIQTLKRKGSSASISERELGGLVSAFERVVNERQEETKVRVKSGGDIWGGGKRDRDEERTAEVMASVPLN
ncbi:hypothetical protein CLAFUW4_04370 [Fulvia fulva]|uniref:Uncharacterized protein n=1 Tax=Passalora fulva TaxID=5499 RepID=A0A9Q8LGR2_PASFU|nr:uncharacterized protein CLAFUR5_04333 [Fulvia fulva]KAK4626045.1 hypothetical protein CLAFUR4_04356 [Fulvia fulva]KAK4627709.1 hypothetical protein CLAFUR0_04357 [Fulvia fulva]UJO17134.1 hypothetical protein CLAFUR5_04333 [Fulvia fulva]WPV14142.1 hypothetical protein CLAFUW4_04370 [Fulvia fulva]WPV28444.1 hypothetical protein CLAFUW7_04359 [Fulvia fulva]